MVNSRGADIIPFPGRQAAAASPRGSDRLSEAMSSLSRALADQQTAVQRWRQAVEDLNHSMQQLNIGVDKPAGFTPHAS